MTFKTFKIPAAALSLVLLGACDQSGMTRQEALALDPLDVIDATNLTELMLTVSDPEDAVAYFRTAMAAEPGRVELRRGFASSLARAGRHREAAIAYEELNGRGQMDDRDRLQYAEVLVRENRFEDAGVQLAVLPDMPNNQRYNLMHALIADSFERWDDADRYYAQARALTTRPSPVLNNWGVSMMSRGDLDRAQDIFSEAVALDPALFSPKNNLVIARGLTGNFALPVLPMDEEEEAQLLHNLALVALRSDQTDIAKGLLRAAMDTHPRFFPAAADKLDALERNVAL